VRIGCPVSAFLSDEEIDRIAAWVAGGLSADGVAPAVADASDVSESAPRPASQDLEAEEQVAGPVTWERVAPIFARCCAKCHTDQGLMGPAPEGFRLTSYESTLSPADRARVVPGNPEASELVRRIRGQARPRMPFDGPPFLEPAEIALIVDWIAAGAPDAAGRVAPVPAGAEVRLHGELVDYWTLDDLSLVVPPGTRIDKNPRPGDYVQIRGVIDLQGGVRAERIRRR